MTNINNCVITGRITKDCEIKTSQNGTTKIVRFSLASNYAKKVNDKWEDEVNYFDCVTFGDAISKYLTKGRMLTISAEARQQRWEDNDGTKRSKIEFVCHSIELGAMPKGDASIPDDRYGEVSQKGPESFDDSEIPF